jgi:predicted RNA-binding protein with PUA-like domain
MASNAPGKAPLGRWLFKTEPGSYSFDRLLAEGRTRWDGVKNPVAVRHLREVRGGDEILVYHTGDEKAVVGIARAEGDGYPDPGDARLAAVDIAAVGRLKRPVPLAAIKEDPRFTGFALVRQGRLSVMPVPADLWQALLDLAGG